MTLNTLLYAASFLTLALGVLHSMLGETYLLKPIIERGNLPRLFGGTDFAVRTLRFAWHLTSIAWFGFAALLLLLTQPLMTYRSVALVVGVTFVGSALFTLSVSRGRHLAWPVLGFVGGVALYLAYA